MRINNLIPENTEGFGGEKPPTEQNSTGNANIEVVVDNSSSIGTSGGESNTLSSVTLKYKENSSHTDGRYNFPLNFGLPEGSAQLTHVQGTGLQYDNQTSFGTSGSTMNMYGICYPPCLAYSADNPLRVTNVNGTEQLAVNAISMGDFLEIKW